uniref:Uncharacterized protein n=1 Tax=Amphimedon queenslandica TaxID=400682 RepID=A0A1X7V409_AMPQE
MLFPMLVLQNPIGKPLDSKVAAKHLVRRIELWKTGAFHLLMDECQTIQSRLPSQVSLRSQDKVHRTFSNLMMKGNTQTAIRLLSDRTRGLFLPIEAFVCPSDPFSGTVFDSLLKKHPQSQPVDPGAVLSDSVPDTHPILYDGIDGQLVRKAALRLSGAAGPLGVDTVQMRRLCVSFGLRSEDL